jgi:hypothetical protein
MQFHELMQRLGVELRLELVPDDNGACTVQLDDLKISFYADGGDAFTAICPLGAVDPADVATHEVLLRGNLFADGVGGSAIGTDDEGGVYLSQCFRAGELGFPQFITALERIANMADYWRAQLARAAQPEAMAAA